MSISRRYAQWRGTDSVLRTLAHLIATDTHATPKQAKEPTFPPTTIGELITDDRGT